MSVGSDVFSLTVGCSLSLGQLLFPGLFRKQIRKYAFFFFFSFFFFLRLIIQIQIFI